MTKAGSDLFKIGLTGGFGTGKSTVLKIFQKFGIPTLDADDLAHKTIAPGKPAYRKIVKFFGREILRPDRSIDRRKLAGLVFRHPGKLMVLNGSVHPPVLRQIRLFLARCRRAGKRRCAVSIPLLFEVGLEHLFDTVVVVKARRKTVMKRVGRLRKMSSAAMLLRMKAQMPLAEKCRRACVVIDNNGSLKHLNKQVRAFLI